MSKPDGVSSFGIGACGGEGWPVREESGARESFFSSVTCSLQPIDTGCRDPTATGPNTAFMNNLHATVAATDINRIVAAADSNRIGRTRSMAPSRVDTAIQSGRSGRLMESSHRLQRSQSFQPGKSRKFPLMDLTIQTAPSNFILPQYIGNQYEVKDQITGSGKSGEDDSSVSSRRKCHHVQCLPHEAFWTLLAIIIPWAGLGLAVLSRQSLNFVKLAKPWHIASIYQDIDSLGIIHAGICYNETVSTMKDNSKVGCFKVALATNEDLEDPIFKLAAVFASISVLVGFILTVSMSTTVIWRTINFRAIGAGYLFVYCFQSLAFLFFDTDICETHECKVDIGCIYCIAASVCWLGSCLLCAKMESNRAKADLAEERKRRKKAAAKEAARKRSIVHRSGGTVMTERTSSIASTVDDELTLDLDEELALSSLTRDKVTKPKHVRHRSLSSSQGHTSTLDLDEELAHSLREKYSKPRHASHRSFSSSRGNMDIPGNPQTQRSHSRDMPQRSSRHRRHSSMSEFIPDSRVTPKKLTRAKSTVSQLADRDTPNKLARAKTTVSQVSRNDFALSRQSNEFMADNGTPQRRQSASGIAMQHESIITLDPTRRYSTGYTTISGSTPKSLDESQGNRSRGRDDCPGLPSRGRSSSKSGRARGRSTNRSKGEQDPRIHRSKSRGRSTTSIKPRARSKSRSKRLPPGASPYARTATREFEEPVPAAKQSQRKGLSRTQTSPADFNYVNVPMSPMPNRSPMQPAGPQYVTSYFDI